jgi:hypothetical protein
MIQERQPKRKLWLLLCEADREDAPWAMATLAWMAEETGALFECYLESRRSAKLFAASGSAVLGGDHFQQLNYLNCVFDVSYVLLGKTSVFSSTITTFGAEILAEADRLPELYSQLIERAALPAPENALLGPESGTPDLAAYLYPEIFFAKALGFPAGSEEEIASVFPELKCAEIQVTGTEPGQVTMEIANQWKSQARGVAFGDPAMIRAIIPKLCRERRVALYAPREPLAPNDVRVAAYPEETSPLAGAAGKMAVELGDPVIVGRQTGDGDIFEFSRSGACIQISDPNRPAFPIVETVEHRWASDEFGFFREEPDDATLEKLADEGRVLATLIWHSGEVAHNEAMLNLIDLAGRTGLKMGLGAHAARYETCPQSWELISVPRSRGGALGLIEPLLHSGGLGVMAECNCPPEKLLEHCRTALERIKRIAGEAGTPRGYYAFMDADMETLSAGSDKLYEAVRDAGMEYFVSSAHPGRNRMVYQSGEFAVLNQTPRSVCAASPFLRVTTLETILETSPLLRPGWMIATFDTPVIAFDPYIWREGSRFMQVVDWLLKPRGVLNVLPHTVARYARILKRRGLLPVPIGGPVTSAS